jgi:hypothetical protein
LKTGKIQETEEKSQFGDRAPKESDVSSSKEVARRPTRHRESVGQSLLSHSILAAKLTL